MSADGTNMTPEVPKTPENPLKSWGEKVKNQIKKGQATGSVSAHTNFDAVRTDSGYQVKAVTGHPDYNKGQGIFLQGDISKKDENNLYEFMGSINSTGRGFPYQTKEDTLYITFANPNNPTLPAGMRLIAKEVQQIVKDDETLIEVRYTRPKSDDAGAGRDSQKWVHLVVPNETAKEFQTMIEAGADPNAVHQTIVDIFTTPETRLYFDASIVDSKDNKTILKNPPVPDFKQTFLTTTPEALGGQVVRKSIDPSPTWKLAYPRAEQPKTPSVKNLGFSPEEARTIQGTRDLINKEKAAPIDTKPNKPVTGEKAKLSNGLYDRLKKGGIDPNKITNSDLQAFIRRFTTKEGEPVRTPTQDDIKKLNLLLTKQNKLGPDGIKQLSEISRSLKSWMEELESNKVEKPQVLSTEKKETRAEVPATKVEEKASRPEDESPEGWIRFILEKIENTEKLSEQLENSDKAKEIWEELIGITKLIPVDANHRGFEFIPAEEDAREYFENKYPQGMFLKERLEVYINARKNLHERYMQIKRSGGSLSAMGLDSDQGGNLTIIKGLQNISPADQWAIIHSDDLFSRDIKTASAAEKRELLPDVNKGLSLWWDVGTLYNELPKELLTDEERKIVAKIKAHTSELPSVKDLYKKRREYGITGQEIEIFSNIPTFLASLNDEGKAASLQRRMIDSLGSNNSYVLADKLFTCWLTKYMWDRDQKNTQDKAEPRGLMYFDGKRVEDFAVKNSSVKPEWTVGRIFARPGQENLIEPKDEISKDKHEKLAVARERAVFAVPKNWYEGEFVGDFLHTAVPESVDSEGVTMYRKLINYAVDEKANPVPDGWKKIPFFRAGEASYSSYFTYNLNIAKAITESLSTPAKPEELLDPQFWIAKGRLFDRLDTLCPYLNSNWEERQWMRKSEASFKNYKEEAKLRFRLVYASGLLWFGSLDAKKGIGGLMAHSDYSVPYVRKVLEVARLSGYFQNERTINDFKHEIQEMGFGSRWWKYIPGLNWVKAQRYRPRP